MRKVAITSIIFILLAEMLVLHPPVIAQPEQDTSVSSEFDTFKRSVEKKVFEVDSKSFSTFSFDDLSYLSSHGNPKGFVKKKLEEHLNRIYISNRKFDAKLEKDYIRVAHWNVERGFFIDDIIDIFTNPTQYENNYASKYKGRKKRKFLDELYALHSADIISLNELDIGMPRTEYENIVEKVADATGWNYAYATEFVEVGPLYQKFDVDVDKYKGLHGNAVLSKYPILKAWVVRLPDAYDWYKGEARKHLSPIEHVRRAGAKVVFREHLTRKEVRHGGRAAIFADIKLPNGEVITVVTTHLEDRTYPDLRLNQFVALLNEMKTLKNPVILAGDFNTSTTDTRPTSINKEIFKRLRDQDFLIRTAVASAVPGFPIGAAFAAVAVSKLLQYHDPFFPDIPVVFPNHERPFYAAIKDFEFVDGGKFDLSGDKSRSYNSKTGVLANSNQRHWKGFKSTYKLESPRVIAYFKLDWFFVKPKQEKYRPFNGRVLKTVNVAKKGGVSDHNPMFVDLELRKGIAERIMEARREERKNLKHVKHNGRELDKQAVNKPDEYNQTN